MSNPNITLRNLRTMEARWRRRNKVQSETETVFRETVADHFKAGADEIERLLLWLGRWVTGETADSDDLEAIALVPMREVTAAMSGKPVPRAKRRAP